MTHRFAPARGARSRGRSDASGTCHRTPRARRLSTFGLRGLAFGGTAAAKPEDRAHGADGRGGGVRGGSEECTRMQGPRGSPLPTRRRAHSRGSHHRVLLVNFVFRRRRLKQSSVRSHRDQLRDRASNFILCLRTHPQTYCIPTTTASKTKQRENRFETSFEGGRPRHVTRNQIR